MEDLREIIMEKEQKELLEAFARKLPRIRKKLGVSQTVLGEKIGLSRQTISSIERGTSPLTWNIYLSILFFLTVNNKNIFYYARENEKREIDVLTKLLRVEK